MNGGKKVQENIWSAFCQCLFLSLDSGLCGRQPNVSLCVCESKTNGDRSWSVSVFLILYLFKAHTCCLIHKCLQAKRTLVLWNLCAEFSLSSYSVLLPSILLPFYFSLCGFCSLHSYSRSQIFTGGCVGELKYSQIALFFTWEGIHQVVFFLG